MYMGFIKASRKQSNNLTGILFNAAKAKVFEFQYMNSPVECSWTAGQEWGSPVCKWDGLAGPEWICVSPYS